MFGFLVAGFNRGPGFTQALKLLAAAVKKLNPGSRRHSGRLAPYLVVHQHGFCYIPCFLWQPLTHASRPPGSSPTPSELRLLRCKGNACAARRGRLPVSRRTWAAMAMRAVRGLDRNLRAQYSQPPARPAGECRIAGMESKTPRSAGTHGGDKGQARRR
jgi:hypothetical protein